MRKILMRYFFCLLCVCMTVMPVFADKSVTALIPVSCSAANTTETFIYNISAETTEYQQLDVTTLKLTDKQDGNFKVTYTLPGKYHYTVKQDKGTDKDTTYDETVYNVDVYVTENDAGEMAAKVVAYVKGNDDKTDKLSFQNKKTAPPAATTYRPSVQTGDTYALIGFCVLLLAALCAAVFGLLKMKRSRK